jgi:hypothetical protein
MKRLQIESGVLVFLALVVAAKLLQSGCESVKELRAESDYSN